MNRKYPSPESSERRQFIREGLIASTTLICANPLSLRAQSAVSVLEVTTTYGTLRGSVDNGVAIFRGVPYAGPVAGINRFRQAPPLAPWSGVRGALALGPPSMQPDKGYYGIDEPKPEENCLVLNVWTPAADAKRRPVMFYSHGGGWTSGSAGAVPQDGASLARTYDVVVVSSNHRLGLLGFLYLGDVAGDAYRTSGNQGLLDIQDALRWVQQNISRFGGDPDNVMIFGESGGGLKSACIYSMPSAKAFFNKASIESGPGLRMLERQDATATTHKVLRYLGLKPTDWQTLLTLPAATLVEAQVAVTPHDTSPRSQFGDRLGLRPESFPFAPVVDGIILPHHPFDPIAPAISINKPLIIGTNRDEMNFIYQMFVSNPESADVYTLTTETLRSRLARELGSRSTEVLAVFTASRPDASPTDIYIAITTARMWWLGSITIAERKSAQEGAPAYMYMFTHHSNYIIPGTHRAMGAGHATEGAYKFNNVHDSRVAPTTEVHVPTLSLLGEPAIIGTDADRMKVAHNMSELWTTFARTGQPGGKDLPAWPAYTSAKRSTMLIDATCKVVDDPFKKEREIFVKQ